MGEAAVTASLESRAAWVIWATRLLTGASMRLALQAAGIGRGDEVVLPAHTFVATLEAVTQAGATPVLVDVTEADGMIDPEAAEAALSSRTRALMPVHLYGHMADMRKIL